MTIDGYTYLTEPVEYRGAKSLYPRLFPLRKDIFFVIDNPKQTEKSKLILDDKTKLAVATDNKDVGQAKIRIIATGKDCTELEVGDVIMPMEEMLRVARGLEMYDGAVFYKTKELYADAVFGPEESKI